MQINLNLGLYSELQAVISAFGGDVSHIFYGKNQNLGHSTEVGSVLVTSFSGNQYISTTLQMGEATISQFLTDYPMAIEANTNPSY